MSKKWYIVQTYSGHVTFLSSGNATLTNGYTAYTKLSDAITTIIVAKAFGNEPIIGTVDLTEIVPFKMNTPKIKTAIERNMKA